MNKYLFLLGGLPPAPSANGVCAEKIMGELYEKEEKNVFCVLWGDESISKNYPYNLFFIPGRNNDQKNYDKRFSFLKRVKHVLRKLFLLPFFPVASLKICKDFYRAASEIIEKEKITHVIAVSFPGESLYALQKLKQRYKESITTIAYPLDVSLEGDRTRFKLWNAITVFFARRTFKKTIRNCDYLLALENAKQLFEESIPEKYHDKIKYVGIPLIEEVKETDFVQKQRKDNGFVLLYSGFLLPDMYNPIPVLDLIEKASCDDKKILFDFYGVIDSSLKKTIETKYKHIVFKDNGWVSDSKLNVAMEKADAFLNIAKEKTNTIPSKFFKYMCFKKTIIHYYHNDDDCCLPYLKKYGNAHLVKSSDIQETTKLELKTILRNNYVGNLEEMFPTCTPRYTSEVIKSLGNK